MIYKARTYCMVCRKCIQVPLYVPRKRDIPATIRFVRSESWSCMDCSGSFADSQHAKTQAKWHRLASKRIQRLLKAISITVTGL